MSLSTASYAGVAATWTMPNLGEVSGAVGAESTFTLEATTESVIDPDLRSLVDKKDFADGGKYRCEFPSSLLVAWC